MDIYKKFKEDCEKEIQAQDSPEVWRNLYTLYRLPNIQKYVYHFEWLGRPIIQIPQDMVQVQELIWRIKPDLIIETGVAHGGSLMLSASMLALLDLAEATENGQLLDPRAPKRRVAGVDIDIRAHNRKAIEAHPLASRITLFEGSSTAPDTVEAVQRFASEFETIMVLLDSNHTHEHVLGELNAYANLVSVNSYCLVFDTIIENLRATVPNRDWGAGNSPQTAVQEFLRSNDTFVVDHAIRNKLLWTAMPDGWLHRVK
jgi:Cephalosporin hydroxylase